MQRFIIYEWERGVNTIVTMVRIITRVLQRTDVSGLRYNRQSWRVEGVWLAGEEREINSLRIVFHR